VAVVALYTNESKDRVRDAVDFVELVSARTELRRAGPARYEGLCPFHDERTPSFGIDPAQKVYHCFGCQASGDVFTFVVETEGVDFKGALELLAERYGVELEREQEDPREAERRRRRERLLELLARTSAYYERYLWDSTEAKRAREYLSGMGLSEEILREFRVGYAPSAWDRVLMASRRGGFSEQELYATGLAQRSKQNGQPYDRFRARIMFPLADIRGRVLGFGARAMREEQPAAGASGPAAGSGAPKYLNTSDNDVYHKGLHLYGADLARPFATRAGQVILCEGYTDTIALHQAGMRNTVGLMGTALTAEQVGELARMAQTVLLALDADSAGQEAMLRASTLAVKSKLELRVVALPAGTDPAELVQREGAAAMREAVEASVHFLRFRVERVLANGDHSSPEGQDRMIDELGPVFAQLEPSAMRMELTELVSSRLAVKGSILEQRLSSDGRRARGPRQSTRTSGAPPAHSSPARGRGLSGREDTERAFLALCIASPEEGAVALESIDVDEHFASKLLRRAARHLREGSLREPMTGAPGRGGGLDDDAELKQLLAELTVQAGREETRPAMLEVQRLQLEMARMDRKIHQARGQHDGDVSALAQRRAEVKREFDHANERVLEETGDRAG
jgi:DNA primase